MRYESERLILTPSDLCPAEALTDYYVRNRDFLTPFDPMREPSFFTVEGQRALLEGEAAQAAADQSYHFYLSLKDALDRIIGMAALNGVMRGAFQSCFLGYKLDGEFLCRGYMSEALERLTEIAFSELGLHRIEANIMPRNLPSLRVAEKAGFKNEGLAEKYLCINGVWEDHIHMVRLNDV